jgi:hypothetical protein
MNNKSRLYNLEKLYSIESKDDNFIKEVVILFVNTIPFISEELVKAANEKKWDRVYFLAHKVKATIDLLNIESLQKEIRFVEESAKSKIHLERISDNANFIDSIIKECVQEIKEDFDSPKTIKTQLNH